MPKKEYKGRRAYLKDFHYNEDGTAEYRGSTYRFPENKDISYIKYKKINIIYLLMICITVVQAGCIPVKGMLNTFYVIIPYISLVAGTFFLGRAIIRSSFSDGILREYIYISTVAKFDQWSNVIVFSGIFTIIAYIINMIFNGISSEKIYMLCFYFFSIFIAVTVAFAFNKWEKQWIWEKQEYRP